MYKINRGYVILDEDNDLVGWADTLEDAEQIVEELEQDNK